MYRASPSQTAIHVALRRAAHQLYDFPIVFDDPLAVPLLSISHAAELERIKQELDKPFSNAMRAHLVARSRFAEDHLAQAVSNGVCQYVVLGAGLDTFAYRNPYAHLHVFEVDHPATQQWKRELLQQAGIAVPANLTYTPVDFEHQDLAQELHITGFDPEAPAFFAWLGVVPYLTQQAFRSTVSYVAERPADSGLVLDYGQPPEALPDAERVAFEKLAAVVAQSGEPFQLFFTPETISLEFSGFSHTEDIGTGEINAGFFALHGNRLQTQGVGKRLFCAWR